MKITKILYFTLLISFLSGANFDLLSTYNNNINNRDFYFSKIIGVMVEFQNEESDDPNTTGRGNFLEELDIDLINESGTRCEGFIVDPPPHNQSYFKDQIIAVTNYFRIASNNNIDIQNSDIDVINTVFELSANMRDYSVSDNTIGELFAEALELAKEDILNHSFFDGTNIDYDDVLFVVFHAGVGQDISFPYFDPTNYDIPSAYIEESMLSTVLEDSWIKENGILNGIILPETLNHIQYDIVEDLFYGIEDYCDYQLGMTGLFSLLMGYALDLPILYNTDEGSAGVGVFGLMDYGSNNGYGVIPSPINPWTKVMKEWDSYQTSDFSTVNIENDIKRIDITQNEYLLIENRNNWIQENISIDSLRNKNKIWSDSYNDSIPGHFFDILTQELDQDLQILISDETNVILGFDNYDYGLPGSGILIWSVNEALINEESLQSGINNNIDNKAIQIKEADGANDIGNGCYHWNPSVCDILTRGWKYDLWYDENNEYFYNNPDFDIITLNDDTNPNLRSSLGALSLIELNGFSPAGSNMSFNYSNNSSLEIEYISDEEIIIKGSGVIDDNGCIFFTNDLSFYKKCFNEEAEVIGPTIEGITLIYSNQIFEASEGSYVDNSSTLQDGVEMLDIYGYISLTEELISSSEGISLGDLDDDGLDEIILVDGEILDVKNDNETSINNFPINIGLNDNFDETILIANILGDSNPEIILRLDNSINIINSNGEISHKLASNNNNKLRLVPNWGDKIALIDGNRLFLFPYDIDHTYWTSQYGTDWNYPQVNPNSQHKIMESVTNYFKFYNYPNPIRDGVTTFRFFYTNETMDPEIRIFDIEGSLVETIESGDMVFQNNEFNEISAQLNNYNTGIYFAELRDGEKSLSIIKVAIIQ